jgi:GxxExxY protein
MSSILYKELSDKIIDLAISVQKELGIGFLEKIYENALELVLIENSFKVEKQKKISVDFHGQNIGDFFADLVIENKIILELKAVEEMHPKHYAQLVNYLKANKYEVGYVINFGKIPLQFKRLASPNN